jgi:hypothetical protein
MDREKVIKQLENDAIATDTGYVEVPLWLFSEIIALLKEQEAVVRCKDCKYVDEGSMECNIKSGWFVVSPNWFCADGKRRIDDA